MNTTHRMSRNPRSLFLLIALLLGPLAIIRASAQVPFQKTYDDNQTFSNNGQCVLPTAGGGQIVAGFAEYQNGSTFVLLSKTDNAGNIQWTKILRGPVNGGYVEDKAYSIRQLYSWGYPIGYIVVGCTKDVNGSNDVLVIRVDNNGDVVWRKAFGSSITDDVAYDVTPVPSEKVSDVSDYVITGYMDADNTGGTPKGQKAFLMRLDPFGNLMWCRKYGFEFPSQPYAGEANVGYSVLPVGGMDNGFVIAGYTNHTGVTWMNRVPFVIHTTSTGAINWSFAYITPLSAFGECFGEAKSITFSDDGNLAVTGWLHRWTSTSHDVFLMELSLASGAVTSFHTYDCKSPSTSSYNDYGFTIRPASGKYVLAGTSDFSAPNVDHVFLMSVPTGGATVNWAKKYLFQPVINPYQGLPVTNTSSVWMEPKGSGYILQGNAMTQGLYLISTDGTGRSGGCEEDLPVVVDSLQVPPLYMPKTGDGCEYADLDTLTESVEHVVDSCQQNTISLPGWKHATVHVAEATLFSIGSNPIISGQALVIRPKGDVSAVTTIRVADMGGRVLYEGSAPATGDEVMIDTHGWSAGLYMLEVTRGDLVESRTISVVR